MAANKSYKRLFEFCTTGDRIGLADYIITNGCCPSAYDARDSAGKTALHIACRHGHFFTVRSLVEIFGCCLAVTDNDGNLPIHDACLYGHLNIVDYLIHFRGIDTVTTVLTTDLEGNTLLHKACQSGSVPLVRYLQEILCYCSKKLVLRKLNSYQDGVGMYSNIPRNKRVNFRIFKLVTCLLASNIYGDTPLNTACRYGHTSVLKVLKLFIPFMTRHQLAVSAMESNHTDPAAFVLNIENSLPFVEVDSESPAYPSPIQQFKLLEETEYVFEHLGVLKKTIECQSCNTSLETEKVAMYNSDTLTGVCSMCYFIGKKAALCLKCPKCSYVPYQKQLDCSINCPHCNNRLQLAESDFHTAPSKQNTDSGYCIPYKSACHNALGSGNLTAFIQISTAVKSLQIDPSWMHATCISDNKNVVAHIMETLNCGPNVLDSKGNTPLHIACLWGSRNVFSYLMEFEDLQVVVLNEDKESPLSLACKYNRTDLCQQLLERFDCNSIAYLDEETPLHLACSNDNLELVKMVVENSGASFINTPDMYGDTPIFNACRNRNLEMIEYLLESNANPFYVNHITKQSPVHIASRMGQSGILEALLSTGRSSKELFSVAETTPVELAIENNHAEVIVLFLNKCKFNLNHLLKKSCNQTLVHYAAVSGHLEIAKLLLKLDSVNWNAQDINGNTALHLACTENNVEVGKLVAENCDSSVITAKNKNLQTPVHIACQYGNIEILKSLLAKLFGTLDNFQDINGDTVLHIAAASHDMVSMLCQYCSVTVKNIACQTPLHIACKEGNAPAVKLMTEFLPQNCSMEDLVDEDGNSVLHAAVESACLETVTTVLAHVSPLCMNKAGEMPIHVSCRNGSLDITRTLLVKKCAIVHSKNGDSYLHSACYGKSLDVVQFLVEESGLAYSSLLSANNQGNTPLHCVCSGLSTLEVLEFLLDSKRLHYVSLSTANEQGNTLLHCACLSGTYEIISSLISSCSSSSDILKLNKDGLTPFCCLLAGGHLNTARELLLAMKIEFCTSEEPLVHCIFKYSKTLMNVFNLIMLVLKRKISELLQCDKESNTVLHTFLYQISKWYHQLSEMSSYDQQKVPVDLIIKELWEDLLAIPGVQFDKQNVNGDTPLHVFVHNITIRVGEEKGMLAKLLSKGVSNSINARNKEGKTPIQIAITDYMRALVSYGADPSDVAHEYKGIIDHFKKNHPLDPVAKIITVGNSTAGKTTLISTLQRMDSPNVPHVGEGPTAGIQTSSHTSKEFGQVKFHDFGGHPEFESGNAVFLKNLASLTYLPIFLLVVDVSKGDYQSLEKTVHYWCNYIKNSMSAQLEIAPHVITIGSHSDCVDSDKLESIKQFITSVVKKISKFCVTDIILLDCREIVSEQIKLLSTKLTECCSSLRKAVEVDCRCHILFAHILKWYRGHSAIQFSALQNQIANKSGIQYCERDVLLPSTTDDLLSLLKILHSGGHIDLLHQDSVNHCWIVLENSLLFKQVNGVLFARDGFNLPKKPPPTPIMSKTELVSLFGPKHIELITTYLTHSEFCQRVDDQESLKLIVSALHNNATLDQMDKYYYFPGLVECKRPHAIWKDDERSSYCFGWYLLCQEHHFFNPRFLQVLLLRLTFNFAAKYSSPLTNPLQRKCDIWKNGIHWSTRTGVEALVEVVQQNTAVVLVMRFTKGCELEGVKHRSLVIKKILDTKEEFCPTTEVAEYILTDCSTYPPSNSSFVFIAEVAQAMCEGECCVIDSVQKNVDMKTLLYFDPYFYHELYKHLWPESDREFYLTEVIHVLDSTTEIVSDINEKWKKEILETNSYLEFRQRCDSYSIFCERNPQVCLYLCVSTIGVYSICTHAGKTDFLHTCTGIIQTSRAPFTVV